jgi:hypothetical protein
MNISKYFNKKQFIVAGMHLLFWTLLLLVPYSTTYQTIKSVSPSTQTIVFVPIIVMGLIQINIFYINYLILIPKYLFTKRYFRYILSLIICMALTWGTAISIFLVSGVSPTRFEDANPQLSIIAPIAKANALLMLAISLIVSFTLGFNKRMKQLEQEKLSAQIGALRSQINPHFLFNTLNSIYATAIETSPQTADMVDKLAEMMRYTMRKTNQDFVPLEEEILYVDNYIKLQQVRLDKSVKVDYVCDIGFSALLITPMIIIPFIENAFKYGVNSEEKSNISIHLKLEGTEFNLRVVNTKVYAQHDTVESNGLGIENTKNRLKHLYPGKHLLTIAETEKEYSVYLYISLR